MLIPLDPLINLYINRYTGFRYIQVNDLDVEAYLSKLASCLLEIVRDYGKNSFFTFDVDVTECKSSSKVSVSSDTGDDIDLMSYDDVITSARYYDMTVFMRSICTDLRLDVDKLDETVVVYQDGILMIMKASINDQLCVRVDELNRVTRNVIFNGRLIAKKVSTCEVILMKNIERLLFLPMQIGVESAFNQFDADQFSKIYNYMTSKGTRIESDSDFD